MTNMEPNKGEIVMYQPDETIRLEVRSAEPKLRALMVARFSFNSAC